MNRTTNTTKHQQKYIDGQLYDGLIKLKESIRDVEQVFIERDIAPTAEIVRLSIKNLKLQYAESALRAVQEQS